MSTVYARRPVSRYRQSLAIIHAALSTAPLHTSRPALEAILRPLYPFGVRKYRPYAAWRRAVRDYLAERERWAEWVGFVERSAEATIFAEAADPLVSRGTSREIGEHGDER